MGDDDRAAHAQADHVDGLGRLCLDHLVVEDELLHEAGSPPAVLLGPGDADIAGVVHLLLPAPATLDEVLLALFGRAVTAGLVGLEPGTDLVAKLLLRPAELEVHAPTLSHGGDHVGREQFERIAVVEEEVLEHEQLDPQLRVALDLFRDLIGGADEHRLPRSREGFVG